MSCSILEGTFIVTAVREEQFADSIRLIFQPFAKVYDSCVGNFVRSFFNTSLYSTLDDVLAQLPIFIQNICVCYYWPTTRDVLVLWTG
jgi:hypothetical protein